MKVLDPGHKYELEVLDGTIPEILTFVKRLIVPGRTEAYPGTTCQEVLRALIDRVDELDKEKPHEVNPKIKYHLRFALTLFEVRALEKKAEKGTLLAEQIETSTQDLHFLLIRKNP